MIISLLSQWAPSKSLVRESNRVNPSPTPFSTQQIPTRRYCGVIGIHTRDKRSRATNRHIHKETKNSEAPTATENENLEPGVKGVGRVTAKRVAGLDPVDERIGIQKMMRMRGWGLTRDSAVVISLERI